jgi:hypothetical protein
MLFHHLLVLSAGLHAAAYTGAAVYAHMTDRHQDMCPFYVLIAFAGLLHLLVVLVQWWKSDHAKPSSAGDDHRAPIRDSRRITYYDDRGEPYFTEWQVVSHSPRTTGQIEHAAHDVLAPEKPKAA